MTRTKNRTPNEIQKDVLAAGSTFFNSGTKAHPNATFSATFGAFSVETP